MNALTQALTVEEFLDLPETKPASEFVQEQIVRKPMPQGEHSRLPGKLREAINQVAEVQKLAYPFPKLRCTFGRESIVPDGSVVRRSKIPRQASGRVANRFNLYPD